MMQLGRIALLALGLPLTGCATAPSAKPAQPQLPTLTETPETQPSESFQDQATPSSDSPPREPVGASAPTPLDSRTPETIRDAIVANRTAVRRCYEEALKTNPGIAGDLVIEFTIRPSGALKNAEVLWAESDIHIPELETCALLAVQAIEFPRSSRGMESKIHYPYNFQPGR